jgi:hypothetical protein
MSGAKRASLTCLCVSLLVAPGSSAESQLDRFPGMSCSSPPPLHCPDAHCSNELIMHPGNATVPKSRRAFFPTVPGVGLGDACSLPDYKLSFIYTSREF